MQGDKIVSIFSKKLNESESNYTTVEKELYAIIKSMEKFKNIVWGKKVHIYTDSKNILSLKEGANKRIQRWKSLLNEFDYKLTHIKGTDNIIADELSRTVQTIKKLKTLTSEKEQIQKERIMLTHIQLIHAGEQKIYNTIKMNNNITLNRSLIKETI